MKIPRPLLVVIVIIVILGVVSCGAGVFRGVNEETEPDASSAASDAGFDGLINGPVEPQDISGPCLDNVHKLITVNTSCELNVEPVALLPRVLKLQVSSGTVFVSVRQEIRGKLQPGSPQTEDFSPSETLEISVSGSTPVIVTLTCFGTCVLDVTR